MKLKSYNILFSIFSFLSDKTNGAPFFVKYKLLLGTLLITLAGTTVQAQKKTVITCYDTIPPNPPNEKESMICDRYIITSKYQDNKPDSILEIRGRVKDEHGEFITGVSISVKGTTNGTITDTDGYFRIKAKSTDKFIFSFVGMDTKEVLVSTMIGGEVVITMKDSDMILCYEVVVVQHYPDDIYRRSKKITKLSYAEIETPPVSPVGNLESFQDWVQSNIQYNEQMLKDKIQGDVILSFAVDKRGKVVDKKVIGKLSKEADEEALRILSMSGMWTPGKHSDGKPIKTTMTISIHYNCK